MKKYGKIYLIGMPGSGKSFLGKPLAEALNIPFVDMDDEIESKEGTSITAIFEESGEDHFRQIEANILKELSLKHSDAVISTGGGTPCFHSGIEKMNKSGITVFLKINQSTLIERLKSESHRPLIQGSVEDKTLQLLADRLPIYSKAHIAIEHRDVSTLIHAIDEFRN